MNFFKKPGQDQLKQATPPPVKSKTGGKLAVRVFGAFMVICLILFVLILMLPKESASTPSSMVDLNNKADLVSSDGTFNVGDKTLATDLSKKPAEPTPVKSNPTPVKQVQPIKKEPVKTALWQGDEVGEGKYNKAFAQEQEQTPVVVTQQPVNQQTATSTEPFQMGNNSMYTRKIPSDTTIPAVLTYTLQTDKPNNPITAYITKDFVVKDKIVVNKGSKLIGITSDITDSGRIFVQFYRIQMPDGTEKEFKAEAKDRDLSMGLKGNAVGEMNKYGGVATEVVVGAGIESMAQPQQTTYQNGTMIANTAQPSFTNSLGKLGGDVVGNIAKSHASKIANSPSVYQVEQGHEFYIYVRDTVNY